uniref:Matrix-remodeling-associated protein 7 helical domain-containing protein n=1 Tax=Onchocerca volvulus TaxID=6282 RepID=A0A8R1TU09_ONCVO
MHTFEDYDDNLYNPDTIMHSLPPYNYANFFQEYPKICLIIAAFCTIVVSMYFWGLFQIRRKEQLDNTVLNGRFSSSVLNKVHQRITDKNADATKFSCGKESFKSETCNNFHDDERNEVVAPFNELYGKLATAKLLAKAKKLENSMTEEERKEEQLIQQKQLESICEMIMQQPEKFGLHNKSEITEQMKLYSV